MDTIGDKIQKLRIEQKMTQEELASKANISYITLVKIEQGKVVNPTVKTIYKIAKALNIKIEALLENE